MPLMLWTELLVGDVVVSSDNAFLVVERDGPIYKWLDLHSGEVVFSNPTGASTLPAGWEAIRRNARDDVV